jgi:hypothetical protein
MESVAGCCLSVCAAAWQRACGSRVCQLAEHASDKLVARDLVVALLVGPGPDMGDEGLPQAPICPYPQGHGVVAARSIPPDPRTTLVLGRLIHVTTSSSASISLGCSCAVHCGPGVHDGDIANAPLALKKRRADLCVLPLMIEHLRGLGCGAREVWAPWSMARLPGAACGA